MNERRPVHAEIAAAQEARLPCALATVVSTHGSVPRAPGAKMLVYGDGRFRARWAAGIRVAGDRRGARSHRAGTPRLKHYLLHEGEPHSFGAICGGEAEVFIEPLRRGSGVDHRRRALFAGHRAAGARRAVFTSAWWRTARISSRRSGFRVRRPAGEPT